MHETGSAAHNTTHGSKFVPIDAVLFDHIIVSIMMISIPPRNWELLPSPEYAVNGLADRHSNHSIRSGSCWGCIYASSPSNYPTDCLEWPLRSDPISVTSRTGKVTSQHPGGTSLSQPHHQNESEIGLFLSQHDFVVNAGVPMGPPPPYSINSL